MLIGVTQQFVHNSWFCTTKGMVKGGVGVHASAGPVDMSVCASAQMRTNLVVEQVLDQTTEGLFPC